MFGKLVRNPNLLRRIETVLNEPHLNASSIKFLTSLRDFINRSGGLTQKQIDGFEKIESAFAPDKREKMDEWVKSYTAEMRNDFNILVQYYKTTAHFKHVIEKATNDVGYIPTAQQWRQMVQNKYAQAVLEATKSEPRFPKGTQVTISPRAPKDTVPSGLRGVTAFVILPDSGPVTSACKGAKKYKILPFKTTCALEIEERYLKRPTATRKKKETIVDESEHTISD